MAAKWPGGRLILVGIIALIIIGISILPPALARKHARDWLRSPERARQGYVYTDPPENCGKYGFIDKTGRFVIEARFDSAGSFSEGLAPVAIGGKWGYINKQGAIVITPQFDRAMGFHAGIASVNLGERFEGKRRVQEGQWFWIDRRGRRLPTGLSDGISIPSEGLTAVKQGDKWGFVDADNKFVIPPSFEWAGRFSDGLAIAEVKGKYGFIDKQGTFVIPPDFDWLGNFDEDIAPAGQNRKYGFIGRQGQWVIPAQFTNVREPSDGLATFEAGEVIGLWGVIDKSGKILAPPRYPQSGGFSEGLAATMISEAVSYAGEREVLWGFIDSTGEFAIPPDFAWAGSFSEGLAPVCVADPNIFHPLIRAIYIGKKEGIQEVLARVQNVNKLDVTPLNVAVIIGRAEAVKLLLAAGADPNKRWPFINVTLLDFAEKRGDKDIIEMIKAATTDTPAETSQGN